MNGLDMTDKPDHEVADYELAHRLAERLADGYDAGAIADKALDKFNDAYAENRPANPEAMFTTIIKNLVRDEHRRHENKRRNVLDFEELLQVRGPRAASLQPVQDDLIRRLLEPLHEAEIEILNARFKNGESAKAVGERLGISEGAVNQRVAAAKKKVQAHAETHPELLQELREPHPHLYPDHHPPRPA